MLFTHWFRRSVGSDDRSLRLSLAHSPETATVFVAGQVDLSDSQTLRAALAYAAAGDEPEVVVDLHACAGLHRSAAIALTDLERCLTRQGRKLRLRSAHPAKCQNLR